jgi:hypothetical protein
LVPTEFQPGTVLAILFQTKHAGISGILSGRVSQAGLQPDGFWMIDCVLSRPLSKDEIGSLI